MLASIFPSRRVSPVRQDSHHPSPTCLRRDVAVTVFTSATMATNKVYAAHYATIANNSNYFAPLSFQLTPQLLEFHADGCFEQSVAPRDQQAFKKIAARNAGAPHPAETENPPRELKRSEITHPVDSIQLGETVRSQAFCRYVSGLRSWPKIMRIYSIRFGTLPAVISSRYGINVTLGSEAIIILERGPSLCLVHVRRGSVELRSTTLPDNVIMLCCARQIAIQLSPQ